MSTKLNHGPEMAMTIPNIFDVRRAACFAMLKTCVPAQVYAIGNNGDVYVVPLVRMSMADGTSTEKSVVKTTLATFQHGGFYVKSPVFVGDTGWLFSADDDTSLVKKENRSILESAEDVTLSRDQKQNKGSQVSQNPRTHHEFCYGFFLPDKWGGVPMPDEFKNSFVIETVKGIKDSDSKGRFVMDPDGTIRIFSTRWYDGNEKDPTKRLKSGSVIVDLKWYGKASPLEKNPTWKLGDFTIDANSLLQGDVRIKPWTDPEGKKHGGNLQVEGEGRFGPYLGTNGKLVADGDLKVGGKSNFAKRMVVKEDNKSCVIDPKLDLHKTDAKFREIAVVTGLKHDKDKQNKVALQVQKMRALVDLPEDFDPVEFEVGGGGGGGDVETDLHSIEFDSNQKLRLASFQGTSRDLDTTLEEDVNEAVENADDVSQEILVRDGEDGDKDLHYQKIGKLVTGLTDDSNVAGDVGQGVVQVTHEQVDDEQKKPYVAVTLKPTAPAANTKKLELALKNIPPKANDGKITLTSGIPEGDDKNPGGDFTVDQADDEEIYLPSIAKDEYKESDWKLLSGDGNGNAKAVAPDKTITVTKGESSTVEKFFGTGDLTIDLTATKLIAGSNITLTTSPDGKSVTISATGGGGTSGVTKEKEVITEIYYDMETYQIKGKREKWKFENGLLTSITDMDPCIIDTVEHSRDMV